MGNSIFFNLGLKETASGVLKKFGATARSVFGGVDKDVRNTQQKLDELGKPIKLRVDTSELKRAHGDVDSLGSKLRGGMIGNVAIGSMIAQGVTGGVRAVIGAVGDVLGAGMEGGQQKGQFEVMAGQKAGDKLFGDLTKYIQDSVFGNSIYQNASTLMGMGDDVNSVMPDLKMLADVSRGQEQKMNTLSLVYGQTMAAGKLTGGDLLQYIGAGFNPLQEISRTTGKSYAQLREEMEAGQITFGMVKDAFASATSEGGRFYGMMAKIEKTTFGKKSAMMGNIDAAKMQMGMALDPAMGSMLDALKVNFIDKLPGMVERAVPVVEKIFSRIEDMLPDMIGFGKSVGAVLKPIGELLLSDGIGKLTKNFIELSTTLMSTLTPAVEVAAGAIGKMADASNWLVDRFKGEWRTLKESYEYYYGKPGVQMSKEELDRIKKTWGLDGTLTTSAFPTRGSQKPGFGRGAWYDSAMKNGRDAEAAAATKAKATATAAADTNSDAIVGGGKKVISINFKNIVENMNVTGATAEERGADMEAKLKNMVYRIFQGVPA